MQSRLKWKERISEALSRLGFEGEVFIIPVLNSNEFIISQLNHKPYLGKLSKDRSFLTIILFEKYEEVADENFQKRRCEALVFDASTCKPLYYSIYLEPESQKIMMSDYGNYKQGDVLYQNNCAHGRFIQRMLDKPIFESEIIDISRLLS